MFQSSWSSSSPCSTWSIHMVVGLLCNFWLTKMSTCHAIGAYALYLPAFTFRCVANFGGAISASMAFPVASLGMAPPVLSSCFLILPSHPSSAGSNSLAWVLFVGLQPLIAAPIWFASVLESTQFQFRYDSRPLLQLPLTMDRCSLALSTRMCACKASLADASMMCALVIAAASMPLSSARSAHFNTAAMKTCLPFLWQTSFPAAAVAVAVAVLLPTAWAGVLALCCHVVLLCRVAGRGALCCCCVLLLRPVRSFKAPALCYNASGEHTITQFFAHLSCSMCVSMFALWHLLKKLVTWTSWNDYATSSWEKSERETNSCQKKGDENVRCPCVVPRSSCSPREDSRSNREPNAMTFTRIVCEETRWSCRPKKKEDVHDGVVRLDGQSQTVDNTLRSQHTSKDRWNDIGATRILPHGGRADALEWIRLDFRSRRISLLRATQDMAPSLALRAARLRLVTNLDFEPKWLGFRQNCNNCKTRSINENIRANHESFQLKHHTACAAHTMLHERTLSPALTHLLNHGSKSRWHRWPIWSFQTVTTFDHVHCLNVPTMALWRTSVASTAQTGRTKQGVDNPESCRWDCSLPAMSVSRLDIQHPPDIPLRQCLSDWNAQTFDDRADKESLSSNRPTRELGSSCPTSILLFHEQYLCALVL